MKMKFMRQKDKKVSKAKVEKHEAQEEKLLKQFKSLHHKEKDKTEIGRY